MLIACGLGFSYRAGTPVLRDVSIELAPGSFTAILGVNGCGKSTLLSCLMGLRKPDAGQVLLDGVPMGEVKRRARAQKSALSKSLRRAARQILQTTLKTIWAPTGFRAATL